MEFKTYKAGKNDNDRRVDKIIRIFLPDLPLSQIYKFLRKGLIKINGKKVNNDTHIFEGDEIMIADFIVNNQNKTENQDSVEKETKDLQNKKTALPQQVFINDHILILNKPYDITVHGDSNSLDKIVQTYYEQELASKNGSLSFKTGPLHRLDRKTTGLIAFSLSLEGARWFSENIKSHTIQKKYAALIQGKLEASAHWCDSIKKLDNSENNGKFVKVSAVSNKKINDEYKDAETFVYPVAYGKYKNCDVTLVKVDIKTGRTHQIRSQCSLHGFPLLGDTAYGGKKLIGSNQDFYLQAYELCFPKENPVCLPEKICIELNENFNSMLKSCSIFTFSL